MNRIALGAFAALLLVAASLFWWQGRAELERGAPPPDISGSGAPGEGAIELPTADPHGRGPGLPNAAKRAQSKEDKRFNRYDRNHDGKIDRTEMLSTRVKAFQKLDVNHDNLLTFEEWAVKTVNRFKEVDKNGDGIISKAELDAYYAAKDAAKEAKAKEPKCSCGGEAAAPSDGKRRLRKGGRDASADDGDPIE